MNYRHAFHAGNFADVVKHAALLQLIAGLQARAGALRIIDTHAGAGAYDLGGPEAVRSGEAQEGVLRLTGAGTPPAPLGPLLRAVRALNPAGEIRLYPGSPLLIAQSLRPADSYLGCELRPDDCRALAQTLAPFRRAEARQADGYGAAAEAASPPGQELVLIDPPFERPDDYVQVVRTVGAVVRRNPSAALMVWLPLKDLETFDSFVRDLENTVRQTILLAETRIRPLSDPMTMNGCALAILGAPAGFETQLSEICTWVAGGFGAGGAARLWTTG